MNRIALNRASPRDLVNLKNSLKYILKIIETINNSGNKILQKLMK
jgi:DNA mismatch repair ATPase MutS